MTSHDVLVQYESRLRELEANLARGRSQDAAMLVAFAFAAIMLLLLGVRAAQHLIPLWWLAPPVPIAAAAALHWRRLRRDASSAWRLRRFYERAVERVNGRWPGEGCDGAEFQDSAHPYSRDLCLFGTGSLFELLCTARTGIGRRALAGFLLAAPPREETLARQEAVRELSQRPDLREATAVMGDFEAAESRRETFTQWLDAPSESFSLALSVTARATSALVLAVILAAALALLPWAKVPRYLLPLIVFHSAAGLFYRQRVKRMMESLRAASLETRMLRQGLQLLEGQRFQSPKLAALAARVQGSTRAIRRLEWLLNALHERNKEWLYQVSLLLMAATQFCMAIERWRRRHGEDLRHWVDAWGEFEALLALAIYSWENPDHTFPELSAQGALFEAQALAHPLLPRETCVRNHVRLNQEVRFYVISGSNMSGKSSLLRAIGLNAVLAFAGAPVAARALRLSPLSVCASISVVDSLLNGKSKFLAEMDRVRLTIESTADRRAVLFLIDEIFSGTNSRDRRAAAEAVVRTLVARGAIGALSTHDMSLTEIADAPLLCGANVHLGARDPADPMSFDYLLKPGITTETNALAIARMAGVRV